MELLGMQVRRWLADHREVALARVLDLQGFSAWAGDPMVAQAGAGGQVGEILGSYGSAAIARVAGEVAEGRLVVVDVDIHGSAIGELGLSCGGQARLLVQPADGIPGDLWDALSSRSGVALVTRIEGPTAGPPSMVVRADGSWIGTVAAGDPDHLAGQATTLLRGGQDGVVQIEDGAGTVLIQAWVPAPRVVVVGDGELVGAVAAQAALLGWESRAAASLEAIDEAFEWAGGSAAVVVLSHDGTLDGTALRAALERGAPYVGAMGSHRTQSRRLERLRAEGVSEELLERIHRPIGLDLGGRRPAEMALAIVAEIQASRTGRDGRPLNQRQGPIHAPVASGAR